MGRKRKFAFARKADLRLSAMPKSAGFKYAALHRLGLKLCCYPKSRGRTG